MTKLENEPGYNKVEVHLFKFLIKDLQTEPQKYHEPPIIRAIR